MDSDTKKLIVFIAIIASMVLGGMVIGPALMDAASGAATSGSATPNLYELTRQTAENTRWIFWVLVVGVIERGCLSSFLMFKKS